MKVQENMNLIGMYLDQINNTDRSMRWCNLSIKDVLCN